MKTILVTAIALLSFNQAYAANHVECYVYDGKTPNGIPMRFLGDSPATDDIYTGGLPDHSSLKYSNGGISIEITDNVGCASQCWHIRKLAIKSDGAVAFAEASAESLNEGNRSMYPAITLRVNGKVLSASCSGPLKKSRSLVEEMGEQLRRQGK